MTGHRMNAFAAAMLVWVAGPAAAQSTGDMSGMDHGVHRAAPESAPAASSDTTPAVPAEATAAQPAMDHSTMDHGTMDHGATPAATPAAAESGSMPGMTHDAPPAGATAPVADHGEMVMQGGIAPVDARDPHGYSAGNTLTTGAYALPPSQRLQMADEHGFGMLRVDRLERGFGDAGNSTAYDAQFRYGRDYNRLVIKAEGDVAHGRLQEGRTEVLWGHAIFPYWDAQLGARYDNGLGPDRGWLAFGVQGLVPYWFEVDAAAYLGNNGRTALRVGAEYELLLSQRLILQPRIEVNAYGKSDPERGLGSGLAEAQAGLRLRYEVTRQFAPYVGVERVASFGKTADLARADGEKTSDTRWVAGVRFWF